MQVGVYGESASENNSLSGFPGVASDMANHRVYQDLGTTAQEKGVPK